MNRPDLDALGHAIGRDIARRRDLIPRARWTRTRRARITRALRRLIGGRP